MAIFGAQFAAFWPYLRDPLTGLFRGWRLAFGIVAAVSLGLAPVICCCLVEPARGDGGASGSATGEKAAPRRHLGICEQVRLIFSRRTFLLLVVSRTPIRALDNRP